MKERPIIFSTPMVQAILAGEKTMTRRIKGLDEINKDSEIHQYRGALPPLNTHVFARMWRGNHVETLHINCPYGKPGDRLWVKETFAPISDKPYSTANVSYKANAVDPKDKNWKWRPSIFMPKAAARIWLEVEKERVERLHDISEEDILTEGVRIPVNGPNNVVFVLGKENSAFSFLPEWKEGEKYTQAQILYAFWAELWCDINGRESWNANPWVWVVKFRRILNKEK